MTQKPLVFIISAPSGSGKSTLSKALERELFGNAGAHIAVAAARTSGGGGGAAGPSPTAAVMIDPTRPLSSNEQVESGRFW